jgi:hypothetical protein
LFFFASDRGVAALPPHYAALPDGDVVPLDAALRAEAAALDARNASESPASARDLRAPAKASARLAGAFRRFPRVENCGPSTTDDSHSIR